MTTTPVRHKIVPLTELELHTLKLHTDQNWNLWQHRPDPPRSIIELRERFLALNAASAPPHNDPLTALATSQEPPPRPNRWDEFLRLEVRWTAILVAIVISMVVWVTSVAIAFIR